MKKLVLLVLTFLLSTACVPQKISFKSIKEKILSLTPISMQAQTPTPYVGLIQLYSPALLASAKLEDGKAIIDEEAKKNIIEEQARMIKKLNALSSEIKILNSYKLVLNAISFVAPGELTEKIAKLEGINLLEENLKFDRPKTFANINKATPVSINEHNPINFIGANELHKLGITGKGMRVGIIDTGIDYTHSMLGGPGKKEIYESINPATANEYFPNQKIIGGMDFVGTDYSPGDTDIEKNIPKPDLNPLDEAGHGSHVSGTVAGIGDGDKTYSGVAPDAKLFALKVFGKEGSTSVIAVVAALEYAVDPDQTLNPNNHLDVVNLSLGGGYGRPKVLYNEAIKNLTKAGTIVVASAGNAGDNPYIVGAPSTSDDAISVAASIDDSPQNVEAPAVALQIGNEASQLLEAVEGSISLSIKTSHVSGTFVYIGNCADPISEEVKLQVKGKIALIDRGAISFLEKLQLAEKLEAIGAVVVNNQDGPPFIMGGDGKVEIPAVMLTLQEGNLIKEALKKNINVQFNFTPGEIIRRDELIDRITDFSSRGPRSIDSLIKPEISGPGSNIISAAMGQGNVGVQFSGTSMSGPHITGVMTLLKEAFPTLTALELKAKVLNTSKILIHDKVLVPVSLQGAGRVQVAEAFKSSVIAMPATLSLGEVTLGSKKSVAKTITLKNITDKDITFNTKAINNKNVQAQMPKSITVKANSTAKMTVSFALTRNNDDQNNIEADGFVILESTNASEKINLPFLAVLNKVTNIRASELLTMTNAKEDKLGAEVKLTLTNTGKNNGDALIFNLLGTDQREVLTPPFNAATGITCDLESAGIRVITKNTDKGEKQFLQVGIKLYDFLTLWQPCNISLQIDTNNDGVADLELAGLKANYVSGIKLEAFASLLLDAKKAREIRSEFEKSPTTVVEDYLPAVIDASEMKFYDHSNVAIIEADMANIKGAASGMVGIKLSVGDVYADDFGNDFLASHKEKWQKINLAENNFAFYDMPEVATVKANSIETLSLRRGAGTARLLTLFPFNGISPTQILTEKLQK